jgi:hypothetical protein
MRATAFGPTGRVDLDRNQAVVQRAEQMKQEPDNVEIFGGKMPEGLELTEEGSKIVVAPGFENRYQVLGTVESDYSKKINSAILKNLYWTWDYEETWRKALCWPQAPLKALSLGIWVLVPTAWPCFAKIPGEEEERQKAHLVQLKKLTAAMGGNLVVLSSSGDLQVTTINARSGAVMGQSITKDMSLKGFALRWNKGAAPAATVASEP